MIVKTDTQTDRETYTQTIRHTDGQTDRHTHTHTQNLWNLEVLTHLKIGPCPALTCPVLT